MARDRALFEGQPVVSVVATDRYVAEDALGAISVDYDPLPHVVDSAVPERMQCVRDGLPLRIEHRRFERHEHACAHGTPRKVCLWRLASTRSTVTASLPARTDSWPGSARARMA